MYLLNSVIEILGALALAGALLALRWLYRRMTYRTVRRLLDQRPQRSPYEFAQTFYGDSELRRELALRLLAILSKNIPLDLSGLEPKDDLQRDLRMDRLDRLAMAQIQWDLEDEFQIRFRPDQIARLGTFEEIMQILEPSRRGMMDGAGLVAGTPRVESPRTARRSQHHAEGPVRDRPTRLARWSGPSA